jgi:hypothetical protein
VGLQYSNKTCTTQRDFPSAQARTFRNSIKHEETQRRPRHFGSFYALCVNKAQRGVGSSLFFIRKLESIMRSEAKECFLRIFCGRQKNLVFLQVLLNEDRYGCNSDYMVTSEVNTQCETIIGMSWQFSLTGK